MSACIPNIGFANSMLQRTVLEAWRAEQCPDEKSHGVERIA